MSRVWGNLLDMSMAIQYISTRGRTPPIGFRAAVLEGLAPDGGLLLPNRLPDARALIEGAPPPPYRELAFRLMRPFCDLSDAVLRTLIERAYATFRDPEITPAIAVGPFHVLELFHGPTLAFKDIALQFLGRLFEETLEETGDRLNLLAATSGDTGSAAIHGVRGCRRIRIFVLHPRGRISPLQERQMTCVLDPNVFNLAVEGTFDDCQRIVKTIFRDVAFKRERRLGAVNSVNWARVLAQTVYYFHAGLSTLRSTGADRVRFAVPTGNFGDIFAGYLAALMGLPVERLILATNENDILARFFATGEYRATAVTPTLSPSMDIQVASNFERYLFHRFDRNPERLRAAMETFERDGRLYAPDAARDPRIAAGRADSEQTLAAIRETWRQYGYLLDPHTAVGVAVAQRAGMGESPLICLATAHPAKFPDAIRRAIGEDRARHEILEALREAPTRCETVPADAARIRDFIASHTRD